MRAVIVDDESLARRGLAARIADHDDVEVVAQHASARQALGSLAEDDPDVYFLDVEMPGLDGLELSRQLADGGFSGEVVFVTAYDAHAVSAFERAACDYLVKPVERDRLAATMDRLRQRLRSRGDGLPRFLTLEVEGQVRRFRADDVQRIEAAGDYMCVIAAGETHVVRQTLGELADALGPDLLRVHRSAAVNVSSIRRFEPNGHGDGTLVLDDGYRVRCSRTYRAEVLARMKVNK